MTPEEAAYCRRTIRSFAFSCGASIVVGTYLIVVTIVYGPAPWYFVAVPVIGMVAAAFTMGMVIGELYLAPRRPILSPKPPTPKER